MCMSGGGAEREGKADSLLSGDPGGVQFQDPGVTTGLEADV